MIRYSDRILFGTDISKWKGSKVTDDRAAAYSRCFRILETADTVEGSFFGNKPIRGLNLPEDVLEKIYYKNAINFYPELKTGMIKLGYKL
jgi:predicted TIM-barrel fold metal-dependent hydrolase